MNILFTVDLKVAVTVVVIRQETGTSRGPKLKNAGLLALPWLLCITVLVIRQETGTNRGPKLKNAGLLALPGQLRLYANLL